jgi:hypothetical protein
MIPRSAYLRQRAVACITALGYLARLNLTGLDAPTDNTATALADNLWREVSPSGVAPEALINACYRAMEVAYA